MEGDLERRIGRNLQRLREAHGLTRADVARRLGRAGSYVDALERGEGRLTLRGLERLAVALGERPLDLLEPDDPVACR